MSVHVVDVSRGVVAKGMRVEVYAAGEPRRLVASGALSAQGTLEHATLATTRLEAGPYEAVFHVADYYARAGFALPAVPFLDVVTFRFGIAEPDQHYHLPMKVTPWGLSCFRGGA